VDRFERWLVEQQRADAVWAEQRRLAWIAQREARRKYAFAEGIRADRASAGVAVDPTPAAATVTAASVSIQVLPGGVSPLYSGSGAGGAPTGGGFWQVGKIVTLAMFGISTTSTSPGSTVFQMNVATSQNVTTGNSLGSSTIALVASQTNITWSWLAWILCTGTGTAGALLGYGRLALGALSTAAGAPYLIPLSGARTTAAVDTTVASALNCLLTLGATTVNFTTEAAFWKTEN
jgi:hypothetical protein